MNAPPEQEVRGDRLAAPWLSVVMPTFNGAPYVAAAIESVEREAPAGVELVVVDDGSTDGTLDIVRRYQRRLAIRILQPPRAGNWVVGTNLGLREAAAPHACFLHQDDLWLPGRLAAIRTAILEGPATLIVHGAVFVNGSGRRVGETRCPLRAGVVAPHDFVERLLVQNFVPIPAPVFDRRAAIDAGLLDPTLWYTADWDLWLKLSATAPVRVLGSPLVAYRVHAASQTMSKRRTQADFEQQLGTVLDRHFAAWAGSAPGRRARSVRRAAEFAIRLNVTMAGAARQERIRLGGVARSLATLGPATTWRFLRDSRVVERVWARLRAS